MLGGGGLVGMGYHAGALKALDEFGADIASSDLLVGTSAGSIMASYLAAGWKASDFFEYAHGRHPAAERDEVGEEEEFRRLLTPMSRSRAERVRRGIGSFFAVASSRGYWPGGALGLIPGARLRHTFPSGLYSTEQTRERLWEDLPEQWPERGLYICAAALYQRKRVAFGSPGAPEAALPDAVLASTAIPGFFPPVRIGGEQYVDGGIVSATSLDLAVEAGCDKILCIAPLGYRADEALPFRNPRMWSPMAVRGLFARTLRREVRSARDAGADVFVIRPWLSELGQHGTNSMRSYDRRALTEQARVGTHRLLDEFRDHPVLRRFGKTSVRENVS